MSSFQPLVLPVAPGVGGAHVFLLDLEPGLYQFSVIADGAAFPWESLYYEMQEFGNEGVRTGPWDFKPLASTPLVPAFWVWLNGEKLGLWPFQRISVEDFAARMFRGNFAFRIEASGSVELRLVPYLDNPVEWLSCTLRPDPVDRLEPLSFDPPLAMQSLTIRRWRDEPWWQARREALEKGGYTPLFRQTVEHGLKLLALSERSSEPCAMTLLIADWRLFGNELARDKALELLDQLVALPGWGRPWGEPTEDTYGWDGDLGAVEQMTACIQAYFGLADELDAARRERVLEKMRYQGGRFLTMALLMRDYWGGSVLQDHGWRGLLGFSECALHLLGEIKEAAHWLEYLVPRFRRAIAAMPRDGDLPPSSFSSANLYLAPLAGLRQAWLEVTGEDLYDTAPVAPILSNMGAYTAKEDSGEAFVQCGLFFIQMAEKDLGHEALYWLERSRSTPIQNIRYVSLLQGLCLGLLHDSGRLPGLIAEPPERTVFYFEDAGKVIYREPGGGLHFQVQCGPWLGSHAWAHSDNPCDRMVIEPGPGHFTISAGERNLLVRPESNYALRSKAHNSLLIDGRGQIGGDLDYPMSLPSWKWRGEQISAFRHDPATGEVFCRLDLQPLYPENLGVVHYTREFVISRGRLLCRDELVLEKALPLTWLFHGLEENGLERLTPTHFRFGGKLDLRVLGTPIALESRVCPTPVVFSYINSGKKFLHAAFESTKPTRTAQVEFEFHLN